MRRSHLLWSPLQPGGSPRWPMTDAYNCCPWLNCSPLSSSKKKKNMNKSVLPKLFFTSQASRCFQLRHHLCPTIVCLFCLGHSVPLFTLWTAKVLSLFDFFFHVCFPSILSSSYLRGRFCHHSFVKPKAYLLFDRRIVRREKGIM